MDPERRIEIQFHSESQSQNHTANNKRQKGGWSIPDIEAVIVQTACPTPGCKSGNAGKQRPFAAAGTESKKGSRKKIGLPF